MNELLSAMLFLITVALAIAVIVDTINKRKERKDEPAYRPCGFRV